LNTERAFDKVRITGLISKFIKAGIPAQFIYIIHNYLKNTAFTVVHRNSESTRRPIQAVVPQGSLLGPVLFNIYINDIQSVENYNNVAVSMYANDMNVTVRSGSVQLAVNKLSDVIKILEPWFEKWRIKITVNKCSTTLFSKRLNHLRYDLPLLKIFRTSIAWSNEVKYLGVILDRKLTYRSHINKAVSKVNHRLG
jgi:hypothetical protein